MFRGATKVSLDDKGRMVMPTRYRERILERGHGKLVITVDRDQCLLLYPLPDWEEIERKLMSLPNLNPQARRFRIAVDDIVANSGRAGTNNVVTPNASFVAASSYSLR